MGEARGQRLRVLPDGEAADAVEGEAEEEILEVNGSPVGAVVSEDAPEAVPNGPVGPMRHGLAEGAGGELEGRDLALEELRLAVGVEDATPRRSWKAALHLRVLGVVLEACPEHMHKVPGWQVTVTSPWRRAIRGSGRMQKDWREREREREREEGEGSMPKTSSSPSPTITPMNPCVKLQPPESLSHQTLIPNPPHPPPRPSPPPIPAAPDAEDDVDLLRSFHHDGHHRSLLMDDDDDDPSPHPSGTLAHSQSPFSSLLIRDDEDELEGPDEEDEIEPEEALIEDRKAPSSAAAPPACSSLDEASATSTVTVPQVTPRIDPSPHVSSQFYTFNRDSHALMVRCIREGRLATPEEIRAATPWSVLKSWRSVWKDRNEDTAYLTGWKRIQDKLHSHTDSSLFFKNNPAQRVSHVDQWQEIVTAAHADPDLLRHLGLKETVDRIKQSWTVGAKFYGIPESFIRLCVSSCPACSSASSSLTSPRGSTLSRSKRRRFEYTESLEVPAKDVQRRLQQLAAKYKVVLCIRQKYIRYKPFIAEVKDYACHRAGEPSSATASAKKARVLKREPYQSKRCGCGFRIRAIVPIMNYNEKEKTFVYQEEGNAIFKLYAIHTGHEPGPLDGNARIIHRAVGNKGAFDFDQEIYGVREEMEPESFFTLIGKDDGGDPRYTVLQQVKELKVEADMLEGRIAKMSSDLLDSLPQELSNILQRLRGLGGGVQPSDEVLRLGDGEITQWGNEGNHHLDRHDRIFSKDAEMIEEEDTDFGSDIGAIVPWDRMTADCQDRKMLMRDGLKPGKWILKEHCSDFDEKSILNCDEDEESKLIKPLSDANLLGMQVDGFYADSTKWYDSPGGLDPSTDSIDSSFRHGGIV
ncbi:hypothetical protein Cni_G18433 [Canna indica]|uniref:Uncharacterized protein n=1 Tax=Canna indica TaxID=4628 RepID=A0AAQ3KKR7_9LILI|nr:hypothetical protein Cni_G18433 [Canna indica]